MTGKKYLGSLPPIKNAEAIFVRKLNTKNATNNRKLGSFGELFSVFMTCLRKRTKSRRLITTTSQINSVRPVKLESVIMMMFRKDKEATKRTSALFDILSRFFMALTTRKTNSAIMITINKIQTICNMGRKL
jgi:hypothetical protein